jgi:hypothetical protein
MKKVKKNRLSITARKKIHGSESMSGCGKVTNNQCGINEKSG